MNGHSSTVRASTESTVGNDGPTERLGSPLRVIREYLRAKSRDSGAASAEVSRSLLQNRSLFLDLVLEEYKASRVESPDLTIGQYVGQFCGLGSSIERSIFRLLEVQQYLDSHPELLELVEEFEWPTSGDTLQGFYVLEELGRGTLSRVYLCQQPQIGERAVVLKVARGGDHEASMMGRLDHPNIVPVYSIAADQQRRVTFICMPFRGRSTLQDLIDHAFAGVPPRRSSLIGEASRLWSKPGDRDLESDSRTAASQAFGGNFVDGVIALAVELAEALAYAHQQDVLHGDFKPSNILLTPQGKPLLIDFNLAKDRRANMGPLGGTLPYMAPEQLAGIASETRVNTAPYDARCEVFSFGVVLFQLLTGHVPFPVDEDVDDPAAAATLLLDRQRTTLPQARTGNPFVNRQLENIILSCLARDPAARPQSMDELRIQLKKQLSPLDRLHRQILAHRKVANAVAATATVFLVLMTAYLSLRPPYEIRQFDYGMAQQRQHDYGTALLYFDRAARANPQFRDAVYQRARMSMSLGDLDAAMSRFRQLTASFNDATSAACLGYCFNLRRQHAEAIPLYERALDQGFESSGLRNNLGVCYLIARSRSDHEDRLLLAERHLRRALELDERSLVVHRNLIRLYIARASIDPSYVPKSALQHLQMVADKDPSDSTVWMDAAKLYGVLAQREPDSTWLAKGIGAIRHAVQCGGGPTAQELTAESGFRVFRTHPQFAGLVESASTVPLGKRPSTPTMFIDPVSSSSDGDVSPEGDRGTGQ